MAHWSVETYGTWLAVLAAVGLLQLPGGAHQNFVGYDLLKHRSRRPRLLALTLRSSLLIGGVLAVLEVLLAAVLSTSVLPRIVPATGDNLRLLDAGWAFFILAVGYGLLWNWGGVWARASAAFGYYERYAWWGVADALVKIVAPLLVIPFGAGPIGAAATLAGFLILLHTATICDMIRVASPFVRRCRGSWRVGARNFLLSQGLLAKAGLEMARQQGVRLLLAPLAGAAEMAVFATTRTGANAALQGLNTITNPLMPELMRFLSLRDQARSEASFGVVWLAVCAVMAPAVVVMQNVAPTAFEWWTHGKIAFDPILFGALSVAVLVFALAQPAMAITMGNNLLRPQLVISAVSGVVAVLGMLVAVPEFGIRAAAYSLLVAELLSLVGYVLVATIWMDGTGMRWPFRAFLSVALSTIVTTISVFVIAAFPAWSTLIAALSLFLLGLCLRLYWKLFPELAKRRVRDIFHRWLPKRANHAISDQ